MRQTQLIRIVQSTLRSEGAEVPLEKVSRVVLTTLNGIAQVLRSGNSVTLQGFGTFYVHRYLGRQGKKPHSPRWQPKFRAGRSFKRTVNQDR